MSVTSLNGASQFNPNIHTFANCDGVVWKKFWDVNRKYKSEQWYIVREEGDFHSPGGMVRPTTSATTYIASVSADSKVRISRDEFKTVTSAIAWASMVYLSLKAK